MGLFSNIFKKKEATQAKKKPTSSIILDRTAVTSRPTSSTRGFFKKPESETVISSTRKEKPTVKKRSVFTSRVSKQDLQPQLKKKRSDSQSRSEISKKTASKLDSSIPEKSRVLRNRPVTVISDIPTVTERKRTAIVSQTKTRGVPFTSTPKKYKDRSTSSSRKRSSSTPTSHKSVSEEPIIRRKHVAPSGSRVNANSSAAVVTLNDNNNSQESRDLNLEHQITKLPTQFLFHEAVTPVLPKEVPKTKENFYVTSDIIGKKGEKNKDGHSQQDNLSRTSSITNLESLEANRLHHKGGTKPRKSSSRERVDKIQEKERKYDGRKGVTKNNNKLDAAGNSYSLDSLQEEEVLQLRRQLQDMANEKSTLALQLGEQKGQLNSLQKEIIKLKSFQEESHLELEKLSEENTILRNRLRDVAHSPLSDNEKQQLIFESQRHHHSSSAPASIATNVIEDNGGDQTACTTPDWDKYSSSNVSEVSVACLQDKINQMQETHYSTNEELQATLQELTDLQRQLTELQQENERLNEEKSLMFDSLCRQTERLNDSRQEVENLKQLLYREKDENGQYETAIEREQKLVDLLKSAQEEHDSLLVKLEQSNSELQESRAGNIKKSEDIIQLSERVRTLECTLDAKHAEHKQLDQELAIAKDQCSGKQIEINRLSDLLDTARTKIIELEQDRTLSDKSELDELLDNARKEKDQFESEVTYLKEQLAISKNETEKLKEQVFVLQEECKVTRNNAKTTQSDLEYKCERLLIDKNTVSEQLQQFQEAVSELQVQSQCHLEDKRQLSAVLSETQRNLSEAERRNLNLENEIQELKKLREQENEEWEKFQDDLLTSVRVANDFKTEAQQELQKFILENKTYRERVRLLEGQVEKLKGEQQVAKEEPVTEDTTTNTVGSTDNMESLFPALQSKRIRDKPRKSKESLESVSSNDKTEKKTDIFSKFVKKREKKPLNRLTKGKTQYSVEEETLLKSLDDWYSNIDKNIPEECLTPEEIAVKKLKFLYQEDSQKEKPVAKKPKAELAISKPFLNSVLLNPKLVQIVNDPKVATVDEENQHRIQHLEDDNHFFIVRESQIPADERYQRVSSEDLGKKKRYSHKMHKSKSLDNLNVFEERRRTAEINALYRSVERQNLATNENFDLKEAQINRISEFSEILPSDSVSNLRYPSTQEVHTTRKSVINYENLDDIISNIPKDCPEHKLKKEERFALRIQRTLDEAKTRTKNLRKIKIKDDVEISAPTQDSVEKNLKLKEIMLNPKIKKAQEEKKAKFFISIFQDAGEKRHSVDTDDLDSSLLKENKIAGMNRTSSKSYEDINFQFMPENTLVNMHSSNNLADHRKRTKIRKPSRSSSSSLSYTSGEFNVVTGLISPTCNVSLSNHGDDSSSDLLYNETLTKSGEGKSNHRRPKDFIQDHIEYDNDPLQGEAAKKYQKQLNQYVQNIDKEIRLKNRDKPLQNVQGFVDVQEKFIVPVVEDIRYEISHNFDDNNGTDVVLRPKKPVAQERVRVKEGRPKSSQRPLSEDVRHNQAIIVDTYKAEMAMINSINVKQKAGEHHRLPVRPKSEEVTFEHSITVEPQTGKVEVAYINSNYGKDVIGESQRKSLKYEEPLVENVCYNFSQLLEKASVEDIKYESPVLLDNTLQLKEALVDEKQDDFLENSQENDCKNLQLVDYGLVQEFISKEQLFATPYVKEYVFTEKADSLSASIEEIEENLNDNQPYVENVSVMQEQPTQEYNDFSEVHSLTVEIPSDSVNEEHYINASAAIHDKNYHETPPEINEDYTYSEMIKENKYGVVSPYDVRYTYKNVVREIKTKFPSMENLTEVHRREVSSDEENDVEENPNFMDDFFGVTTRKKSDAPIFSSSESLDSSSSSSAHRISRGVTRETIFVETNSSKIDQEMQDILEKYLHTRASLLVKDSGVQKIGEKEQVKQEPRSNLKKFDNVENLHAIDEKPFEISDSVNLADVPSIQNAEDTLIKDAPSGKGPEPADAINDTEFILMQVPEVKIEHSTEESTMVYDSQNTNGSTIIGSNPEDSEKDPRANKNEETDIFSEEDAKFMEDMKKKYTEEHSEHEHEDSKGEPNNFDISALSFTDKEIKDKYEHLTPDELELIRSVKKDRFSRPLSEINEVDLALIEEVTKRYFTETSDILETASDTIELEDSSFGQVKDQMSCVGVEAVNIVSVPQEEELKLESNSCTSSENHQNEIKSGSFSDKEQDIKIEMIETKDLNAKEEQNPHNECQISICKDLNKQEPVKEPTQLAENKSDELFFDRHVVLRHTMIPKPVATRSVVSHSRRQIRSWAEFQKRTLDGALSYEPVYSNITIASSKRNQKTYDKIAAGSNKIEKLPLPVSTIENDNADVIESRLNSNKGTVPGEDNQRLFVSSDDSLLKMTDSKENFCEGETVTAEVLSKEEGTLLDKIESKVLTKITGLNGDAEPDLEVISNQLKENVIPVEMNSSTTKKETISQEEGAESDEACSLSPTDKSFSTIEIAGKFEQLDLTKAQQGGAGGPYIAEDEEVEEVSRRTSASEHSNVNLFNIGTPSYDESYLNMFQTKEQEVFDKLSGKKKQLAGYFDITYVEEILDDDDSYDDVTKDKMFKKHEALVELQETDSKPKIVDFVPLDDDTKPYFTKEPLDEALGSYDTLEREQTFNVLATAAKAGKPQARASNTDVSPSPATKDEGSLEVLARHSSSCSKASSKSVTDTSRTSFSQAKKIFEALVEANNNTDGTNKEPAKAAGKPKPKFSVKSSKSNISTDKMHVAKSDVNMSKPVGETILVVKEGKSFVIEPDEQ